MKHKSPGLALILLSIVFLGLYFWPQSQLDLFSANSIKTWDTFADDGDHGQSLAEKLGEKYPAQAALSLRSGYSYPYCGLTVYFSDSLKGPVTPLGQFDTLKVKLNSYYAGRLKLNIRVREPGKTLLADENSYRVLEYRLSNLSRGTHEYSIPLQDFEVADWWKDVQTDLKFPSEQYLDSVSSLSIILQKNDLKEGQKEFQQNDTIILEAISAVPASKSTQNLWLGLLSLVLGIVVLLRFKRWMTPKVERESRLFDLGEKPKSEWDEFQAYMQKNYRNPDLTQEKACYTLGWSSSKLSRLLHDHDTHGFKSYLNDLRMERAAHLLKATDSQVSQIALDCGYNSPAHFNRVFKAKYEMSPTEYRSQTNN